MLIMIVNAKFSGSTINYHIENKTLTKEEIEARRNASS